jgi:hypothetical protein
MPRASSERMAPVRSRERASDAGAPIHEPGRAQERPQCQTVEKASPARKQDACYQGVGGVPAPLFRQSECRASSARIAPVHPGAPRKCADAAPARPPVERARVATNIKGSQLGLVYRPDGERQGGSHRRGLPSSAQWSVRRTAPPRAGGASQGWQRSSPLPGRHWRYSRTRKGVTLALFADLEDSGANGSAAPFRNGGSHSAPVVRVGQLQVGPIARSRTAAIVAASSSARVERARVAAIVERSPARACEARQGGSHRRALPSSGL